MKKQTQELIKAAVQEQFNTMEAFGGGELEQFGTTDLGEIVEYLYDRFQDLATTDYANKASNFDGAKAIKRGLEAEYLKKRNEWNMENEARITNVTMDGKPYASLWDAIKAMNGIK